MIKNLQLSDLVFIPLLVLLVIGATQEESLGIGAMLGIIYSMVYFLIWRERFK